MRQRGVRVDVYTKETMATFYDGVASDFDDINTT